MKMLGLNPSDQALLDIPNKIGREDGLIYFPDFCQLCLEYFRQGQEEEEEFRKNLFKVNQCSSLLSRLVLQLLSYRFSVEQSLYQQITGRRNIKLRRKYLCFKLSIFYPISSECWLRVQVLFRRTFRRLAILKYFFEFPCYSAGGIHQNNEDSASLCV